MVEAADEQVHDEGPGNGPSAREAYDFVWWDSGVGGLARVVYDLAEAKVEGSLELYVGGRATAGGSLATTPMIGPPGPAEYGVRAGTLALTLREPLARWHIGHHGPTVDLRWTSSQKAVRVGSRFLQAGRVTGAVEDRSGRRTVHAPSVRSRSWTPTGGPSLVLQAGDLVFGLHATPRSVTAAVLALDADVLGFEQLRCATDGDGTVRIEGLDDLGRTVAVRVSSVPRRRRRTSRRSLAVVHGEIGIDGAWLPAFGRLDGHLGSVALERDELAVVTR